jgi:hypothetical protein
MIAVVKAYLDNTVGVRLLFHDAYQPDCCCALAMAYRWINSEASIA